MKIKLLLVLLLIGGSLFYPISSSYAIEIELGEEIICEGTEMFDGISYQGKKIEIPFVVGINEEKSYPIYALHNEKIGASMVLSYPVKTQPFSEQNNIKKILQLGYPNCTPSEMGCKDSEQGYIMTQMAIFDQYYHYNLTQFSIEQEISEGEELLSKIINFIEKIRREKTESELIEITIDSEQIEWQEEEGFCSKTYQILAKEYLKSYVVELVDQDNEMIQILDQDCQERKEFQQDEKFRVQFPKGENQQFEIQITATILKPPVVLGKPYAEQLREYVFLGDTTKVIERLKEEYKEEIIKEEIKQEDQKEEIKEQQVIRQFICSEKKEIQILPQTGF